MKKFLSFAEDLRILLRIVRVMTTNKLISNVTPSEHNVRKTKCA